MLFLGIPLSVWLSGFGALSGVGGIATWYFGARSYRQMLDRNRIKMAADVMAVEASERHEFRVTLLSEIAALRLLIKGCEEEKDALRNQLALAQGQVQILHAANEIMERWVAFFKSRHSELE